MKLTKSILSSTRNIRNSPPLTNLGGLKPKNKIDARKTKKTI